MKYQSDDFMENPNLYLLNLFDFSFCKNFSQLIKSLDSELPLFLLKNICGLLSNEDFADYLIVQIKNNLSDMIIDWTLSGNSNKLELDLYPIYFYDSEFIKSITSINEDYSRFLESFNNEPKKHKKVSFITFYKIKKFYKKFLLEMINFVNYNFMKHSFIKYASKIENFDYHIFVTVWRVDYEDWTEGMFDQVKSIADEILGDVTIQIVIPRSGDGYDNRVIFARDHDYYNRISSKYLIVKEKAGKTRSFYL